jgi:hypothetical protein
MDFLRGRSERNGEAYVSWYVEPLSAARTKQKTIFIDLKKQKPPSLSFVQGRRLDALRGTTLVRC